MVFFKHKLKKGCYNRGRGGTEVRKRVWIIVIILFLLIFISIYCIFWNPFLKIEIKGLKEEEVPVFSKYKDPYVKATLFGKDITKKVKVKTILDLNKTGKYTVKYSISFLKTKSSVERIIKVVDHEKPVLKLKGNSSLDLYVGDTYEEAGYEVLDNYDKDLEKNVRIDGSVDTSKVGEYTLHYEVTDHSGNKGSTERKITVKEKPITRPIYTGGYEDIVPGPTYIKGILLVNKKYALPSSFAKGVDPQAASALTKLQKAAKDAGYTISTLSGYRSYARQVELYNAYVQRDGKQKADTYSARPGHSEHQTGLTFDIGAIENNYGETAAGKWLQAHCHEYGFIIRYPKGKESITGFQYEPWHVRYIGIEAATEVQKKGITLEEYLGVV